MPNELAGRRALVTGASRGIGAAIAERFAAEGAELVLTARSLDPHPTLPGTLRETAAAIERHGGNATAIATDLSDPAARARLAEEVLDRVGPIDVLVNNAAASFYLPFGKISEKRYRIIFELNVRAPFDLAQRFLAGLRAHGDGVVLNLSSRTAECPEGPPFDAFARAGHSLLYGSTKAALERFSAGLAAELAGDGVRVNALAPVGAVRTPGVEALGMVPEEALAAAESIEALAEASVALCAPALALTGRIALCTPLLEETGRPVRSLDGTRVLQECAR